jgi:hypothetical protein
MALVIGEGADRSMTTYAVTVSREPPKWVVRVAGLPGSRATGRFDHLEAEARGLIAGLTGTHPGSFGLLWAYAWRAPQDNPAVYTPRIISSYTRRMPVTTMKVQTEVRDRLARIAAEDYRGATLSDALALLVSEHERARARQEIAAAYARLQADPQAWAGYVAELEEWDGVTADDAERG